MTLDDQLQELRFSILHDHSDIIAGDTDSLWSDETLVRYIKDAERRFARRTMILRDSTTPSVTQIVLRTGKITYPTHDSVIAVLSARYAGQEADLRRSGHAMVEPNGSPESLAFDPSMPYTASPGAPVAYYTDETTVFARQSKVAFSVYPAPSAAEDGKIVNLRVIRLPVTDYALTALARESEIPEDYQLDVLEWAAYRAQRGFDADAGAPTSADAHKKAFEDAIGNAIRELKRKMFASTGLGYGGNGFTWSR